MLQIAIHRQDKVALRMVKSRRQRRCLPKVPAQLDDQHARVYSGDLLKQPVRAVPRSVIHKDQLKAFTNMLHNGFYAVIKSGDVLFFVVKRNNDGIFWHPWIIRPSLDREPLPPPREPWEIAATTGEIAASRSAPVRRPQRHRQLAPEWPAVLAPGDRRAQRHFLLAQRHSKAR